MSFGTSFDHYNTVFKEAFAITKRQIKFWPLAVFAAILNTGVLLQGLLDTTYLLSSPNTIAFTLLKRIEATIPFIITYGEWMTRADTATFITSLAISIMAALSLVYVALVAQHLLVAAIQKTGPKARFVPVRKILRELNHVHVLRLLSVNAGRRILASIVVLGASFPLTALLTGGHVSDVFTFTGFFLVLLPISFVIQAMSIFLVVYVAQDVSLFEAFGRSWRILSKNWMHVGEAAVLLFCLNLIAVIAAVFTGLLGISALGLAVTALSVVAPAVAGALEIAAGTLLFLFAGAFLGAVVTFNYSVWVRLLEHLEGKGILSFVEHAFNRLVNRS